MSNTCPDCDSPKVDVDGEALCLDCSADDGKYAICAGCQQPILIDDVVADSDGNDWHDYCRKDALADAIDTAYERMISRTY
jgi:hypothetical protein